MDEDDPPLRRRADAMRDAVLDRAARVPGALAGLRTRARDWDDSRRTTSFVPEGERVALDVRRHPFLLVPPALRTPVGLLMLATGPRLLPLLLFAAVVAVWMRGRHKAGLRTTGLVAGGATLGVLVVEAVLGPVLAALLLVGWLLEDVADWASDRLVVSERRIYRRHGVVTRHSPSISLTAIAYLDASVPPVGRLVGYGTLRLDSVAQQDAPLARFDLVPDVEAVSHEILRLRGQAMPKYPQQPF